MTDTNRLKAWANHTAYEVWANARRESARAENMTEWQRLNKSAIALCTFSPLFSAKIQSNAEN